MMRMPMSQGVGSHRCGIQIGDPAGLGVTVGPDHRLAAAEFRLYIRVARYCRHNNICIFNIPYSNPMNRRLAPSPASPLIARFGCPDWRKWPPVRPCRQAAGKYLIRIALSRITGSKFSAESTIRPVLPLLQGSVGARHRNGSSEVRTNI